MRTELLLEGGTDGCTAGGWRGVANGVGGGGRGVEGGGAGGATG